MPDFSLPKIEEKIQKFWETNKIFEKSLENRKGGKKFVFYEGPPTANGMPHLGHFETRAFKDLFVRYKTMRGFHVPRRAGWDTHGLPVEIEVEKKLGFSGKRDIERYGIAKFNKEAKRSVWKYKAEWEKFSRRIGFWLDFDNPYITYANDYIEKLWHIVKQFDKKKLLYKDYKVVPYCPRCGTPLSSHEVSAEHEAYKNITENSVIVKFPLLSQFNSNDMSLKLDSRFKTYILSWTTTPWTLPGNVALAVGEKVDYVIVEKQGERFIVAKELVEKVFDSNVLAFQSFKGKELVGLEYEPLFEVPQLKSDKSHKVYAADFVTTEDGTGVVHTAVMYGEDDFNLGKEVGLPKFHTVDSEGNFVKGLGYGLDGLAVKSKQAEEKILAFLKDKGLLFKEQEYSHDYPFCWRCKHPLLYYAVDSWFVKTTAVKDRLIANNKKINWVPSYIKEGRFGQWLNEVKDWAFSRERYWGTPLPVWQCGECEEKMVVGSLEELGKRRYRKPNRYFILRHAESEKNNFHGNEIISSRLEDDKYDLTEKGVSQAEEVGKRLKKEKIDFIFSSPFLRTKRTAEIVAKELGLGFKTDERLKEFYHGAACEGKDHMVCIHQNNYPPKDFETRISLDSESWNEVRKRMFDLVSELEKEYEGKKILIVSHGDPLWLLEGISENAGDDELLEEKRGDGKEYIEKGELRELDFKNLPRDEFGNLDLHRPYIDEISLRCQKCGGEMRRVPDVIDVWFDSGAMPFASEADFPADFITEGVDQTRGWFYTLLAVSTLLELEPPYRNVISLGHVLDKDGKKMSKSIGNVISPDHVIEKFGADVSRWWFYRVNQAGESKNFREEDLKEIQNGLVRVIINSLRFWKLYKGQKPGKDFHSANKKDLPILDKWLLSRWNTLVGSVTKSLDDYDATTASRGIEKFVVEDLSNWWIRRSRANFSPYGGSPEGRQLKSDLLRFVLLELAKLLAPFVPFLAEHIHEELYRGTASGTASVHLHDWPESNKKMIDGKLERDMELARRIASLGLAARKEKNIKVRQPLNKLGIRTTNNEQLTTDNELLDLVKEEVNVKEIVFEKGEGDISVFLDSEITPALRAEGLVREFVRMIQDARKDAGYDFDQRVEAFWSTEDKFLKDAVLREAGFIKQKTVLKDLRESGHNPDIVYDVEMESELEPGQKIWLGLKK